MEQQQFRGDVEVPLVREFTDEDGNRWEVIEVDGSVVPAARGERCLVFRAPHAIRRVWDYPNGWPCLTEPELLELSWHR